MNRESLENSNRAASLAGRMLATVRKLTAPRRANTNLIVPYAITTNGLLTVRPITGAVERLTGGVAHDINNLLQAVSGNLELLGDVVAGDSEAEELVRNISRSAGSGAKLTHQLLSFCRQQLVAAAQADMLGVMDRMRDLLPRTLGSQASVIFSDAPEFLHDRILVGADPGQIELCVLTIALAVFDAMSPGGAITVRTRCQTIADPTEDGIPAGRHVVVAIADRNAAPGNMARDLSGIADLARSAGAALRAGNGDDGTSCIELWLPITLAEPPAAAIAPRGLARQPRVLLVDDAPDVLITLSAFLEGEGFAVVTAHNGHDALAMMAKTGRVDVVVTDFAMPGMSGAELLDRIAAIAPSLPAVVVTGFAAVEKLAVLRDNVEVLRKPFRRDYLVQRVRALAHLAPESNPGGESLTPVKCRTI